MMFVGFLNSLIRWRINILFAFSYMNVLHLFPLPFNKLNG
jgi:hypothetical protein